jgi:hypothetical protein
MRDPRRLVSVGKARLSVMGGEILSSFCQVKKKNKNKRKIKIN